MRTNTKPPVALLSAVLLLALFVGTGIADLPPGNLFFRALLTTNTPEPKGASTSDRRAPLLKDQSSNNSAKTETQSKSVDEDQIIYDPSTEQQRKLWNAVMLRTSECVRGAVKAQLRVGVRSRTQIVQFVSAACPAGLAAVAPSLGLSKDQVARLLRQEAEDAIDEVTR